MEIEKGFEDSNLIRKRIIYPAYQTTHRFHNLYSDVRTFIRELIQNADDADAQSIQFNINLPKEIEVINDGKPFDSNDIERLLTPCLGGKEFDKTGAMNLGALSVLSVSDKPFYHSGNTLLKFEMNHDLEEFTPYINENYDDLYDGTRLILPLHSRLSSDDLKKLNKIDEYLIQYSPLLFTRKLEKITLNYPNKTFNLKKIKENEKSIKFNKIQANIMNIIISERCLRGKNTEFKENNWFVAKHTISIPDKYFSKKELKIYPEGIHIPIYFAFAFENNLPKRVDYPVYIIFPSDTQFGLGFVLSSNFKPETSRKGISTEGFDGNFNRFLLRKASELIELSLFYFKKEISSFPLTEKIDFFIALLETFYYRETYSSLESYVKEYIHKKIIKFLEKNILDQKGNWYRSSKIAIAGPGLASFFKKRFKFIDPPLNEKITNLLKIAGVRQLTISDLIYNISNGLIKESQDLFNAWTYLSIHRNEIDNQLISQLLNNKTLPNRMGKLTIPRLLIIPHEDATKLYDSHKEIDSNFIENQSLRAFIISLGVPKLTHQQVLEYFISIKSSLSLKNLELIKNYYKYFHKFGLLEKKRKIILTNKGFKNPNEAFFDRSSNKELLGNKVPLIPKELVTSKKCKMYLENLGVSKEIKAKFIVKQIKKYGSGIISLELLKFLSKNIRDLSNQDLKNLEQCELIPTTEGKFVKPSECYLLNDKNKMILGDLVNYFDPKDQFNKDWLKFFKKIGISKYPKIEHLRLAIKESIRTYEILNKNDEKVQNEIMKRIELILSSLVKNDQKDEKDEFIYELINSHFIPTTKGLMCPNKIYIRENNVIELLGESVPYPLIDIPDKLVNILNINKNPIPEDVANYLLKFLRKDKNLTNQNRKNEEFIKLFDKIYSFLGTTENFNKLHTNTIKKLINKSIIYLPNYYCFNKASNLVLFSKEAEMIIGNSRNLIRYSDYPNSLNFFKRIGVKTSINSDDIADFLIDYINQGNIDTQRLFMFYNILGQRFRFLSKTLKIKLKKSKIILCNDLKSFEYPENVHIPDESLYVEKFPSIKVAIVNDKILEFLENLGVKRVSEVIIKTIIFSGEIMESDYSKIITKKIIELIPFIEAIIKDSNVNLDKNWKSRVFKIRFLISEHIFYDLQYKNKKSRIQGKSVEYDSNKNVIGVRKEIYENDPMKFLMDLSKAIAHCIFIGDLPKAKIISPLIEKLILSENKLQTLKELGFSTYNLEVKKYNVPKVKLNLIETPILKENSLNRKKIIEKRSFYYDLPKISQDRHSKGISWNPTKLKVKKEEDRIETQSKMVNFSKSQTIKSDDQIDILIKSPPPQNKMANFIKENINTYFNFKNNQISRYYNINNDIKNILRQKKKIQYKSMEFSGRAEFGGFDLTPPIPKLIIKKVNAFHYYIQEGFDFSVDVILLNKFKKMIRFIVNLMGGNPDTVSIAIFNGPIEAFNHNGQLIFNYFLLMDKDLEDDYPLFLIWILIAAHELAHNICSNHDQLHSKYMMIFTLQALKNLDSIKERYFSLFNTN